MKKTIVALVAVSCAAAVFAQQNNRRNRGPAPMPGAEGAVTQGRDAKVLVDQFPKTGQASALSAPVLQGQTTIGKCYQKPRKWLVFEMKYTTFVKWQDQLTFTWHILLESKSATEKDRADDKAPYSYYTTSVTYSNIPQGSHAASVVLPPSILERYGYAKAIGVVISNKNGDVLGGQSESEVKGIESGSQWWNNNDIMDAKDTKTGGMMIERRQGLLERSKTIWGLVNPNDYEMVEM